MGEPVQLVVGVRSLLVLAVNFRSKVVVRVVAVRFRECGRERGLGNPAEGIIGERRRMIVCILDAGQIVLRVVAVCRDVTRGIGYRY